jgi:hypothetical protein
MKEIICYLREIFVTQVRPVRLGQFTPDVDLVVKIIVHILISGYQKFQVTLFDRCDRLLGYFSCFEDLRLYWLGCKNVGLHTHGHGFNRHGRTETDVF